ncbi:MAG: hypothetical protein ACYDCO_01235 [Armatimonadota bacterium]
MLAGLTFTLETFACGVDIDGPSNLVTLLQNAPPHWLPIGSIIAWSRGKTTKGRKSFIPLDWG